MNLNISITAETLTPVIQAVKPFAIAYICFVGVVMLMFFAIIGTIFYKILKGR